MFFYGVLIRLYATTYGSELRNLTFVTGIESVTHDDVPNVSEQHVTSIRYLRPKLGLYSFIRYDGKDERHN